MEGLNKLNLTISSEAHKELQELEIPLGQGVRIDAELIGG